MYSKDKFMIKRKVIAWSTQEIEIFLMRSGEASDVEVFLLNEELSSSCKIG